MGRLLEILVVALLLLWLLGAFVMPIGGKMIHQLVVLALGLAAVRVLLAFDLFPRLSGSTRPGGEWDEDLRLPG